MAAFQERPWGRELDTRLDGFSISLYRKGLFSYEKLSYPAEYGIYHEVAGMGLRALFDLECRLKAFKAETSDWPHPHDWIRITSGGELVYYSYGGYADAPSLYCEYYVPVPARGGNSIFPENPFAKSSVRHAIDSLPAWLRALAAVEARCDQPESREFVAGVRKHGDPINNAHKLKARFSKTARGTVPVLPPDTRHVNYNAIPLLIQDGCLYNCGFCTVKTSSLFRERSPVEIARQAFSLREFFGKDLANWNGVFLGQNDALACSPVTIECAIEAATRILEVKQSCITPPSIFMFASVKSVTGARDALFDLLSDSGFRCFINVGFESFHDPTLKQLQKPVDAGQVREAAERVLELSCTRKNLTISGNFVLGTGMSERHLELIADFMSTDSEAGKMPLYLSPLVGERNIGSLLRTVRRLQKEGSGRCCLYQIITL